MNRQQRRQLQRRSDESGELVPDRPLASVSTAAASEPDDFQADSGRTAREALAPSRHRSGPRQFLHEVNVEMRKVAWPTRAETLNYSTVVFITLAVIIALIF